MNAERNQAALSASIEVWDVLEGDKNTSMVKCVVGRGGDELFVLSTFFSTLSKNIRLHNIS